jgi:hypothetical protein
MLGGNARRARPALSVDSAILARKNVPSDPTESHHRGTDDTPLTPALSPRNRVEREMENQTLLIVFLVFGSFSAEGRNSVDTALACHPGRATEPGALPANG